MRVRGMPPQKENTKGQGKGTPLGERSKRKHYLWKSMGRDPRGLTEQTVCCWASSGQPARSDCGTDVAACGSTCGGNP